MKKKGREGRKKVIPDRLFNKLWTDADKVNNKSEFIKKYTSSISASRIEFKKRYGIEYEESISLLDEIYEKQHMSFKNILEVAGKRKADIANTFCIPIRTVEEWYAGHNKCTSYIRLMIIRQYHLLELGKYIYVEAEENYKASMPEVYKKRACTDTNVSDEKTADEVKMDEDKKLQDIDEWLQSLERKRSERRQVQTDTSIKSLLDKTSFLDDYLKK